MYTITVGDIVSVFIVNVLLGANQYTIIRAECVRGYNNHPNVHSSPFSNSTNSRPLDLERFMPGGGGGGTQYVKVYA